MGIEIKANRASRLIRQTGSSRYLIFKIIGSAEPGQAVNKVPLNFCLVLDRSGSMEGEKLARIKEAAIDVVQHLTSADKVGVIAYDDTVQTVADAGAAVASHKSAVISAIKSIRSGNSTNLSDGWLTGCEMVARQQNQSRSIDCAWLLTDGLANQGIVNPQELGQHAEQLRKRGISTTTFGVGDGFNEDLLRLMADKGGGNFYFLSSAGNASANFIGELQERMTTVARNLELQITFDNPGVQVECLNDYEQNVKPGTLQVFPGDLYAGEEKLLVVHVATPPGIRAGQVLYPQVTLKYTDATTGAIRQQAGATDLSLLCASDRECDSQEVDSESALHIASIFVAQARQLIVTANRQGDYKAIAEIPGRLHQRLYRAKIAHLAAVKTLQNEIDQLAQEAAQPMTEMRRKTEHYTSHMVQRNRKGY